MENRKETEIKQCLKVLSEVYQAKDGTKLLSPLLFSAVAVLGFGLKSNSQRKMTACLVSFIKPLSKTFPRWKMS